MNQDMLTHPGEVLKEEFRQRLSLKLKRRSPLRCHART